MTIKSQIELKLTTGLKPVFLNVEDESHLHKGHAGTRPEGETHFRVTIVSDNFDGLSRLARHRAVQGLLKEELAGPVHALALKTISRTEYLATKPDTADAK